MSNNAKWVISAICAVVGIIALIYAVIYLAVPIHSLPGFVPGKKVATGGHYHKRAFISAVIGVVLLAIVVYLGMTARRSTSAGSVAGAAPAGSATQSVGDGGSPGDS